MFKLPLRTFTIVTTLTLLFFSNSPIHAESKSDAEKAGGLLFRDKGCAYCHGPSATGTAKGPSLAKVRKTMKPPAIANQIENGGQKMPPFDESLSHDEVMRLVQFLRAKKRPFAPPLSSTTPGAPAPMPAPGQP